MPLRTEHHGNDLMVGAVKRGTHEVVHGGVDDEELLGIVLLAVNYPCEQDACRAYDRASRLK